MTDPRQDDADEVTAPEQRSPGGRRRRVLIVAAIVVVLIAIAIAARGPILSFVLGRGLSLATGYDVRIGGTSIGPAHAALFDVHIGKNGDAVLDARRIDVDYQLRDIFPGGDHRFGFVSLAIDRPVLTIVRHADGTFNFNRGGSTSTAPAATKHAGAPLYFTLRVRDGTANIVDLAALDPLSKHQRLERVAIDASVKSNVRTHWTMSGVYVGAPRRALAHIPQTFPLDGSGTIDYAHRYAMHRLRARVLPIRAAMNFLVNTKDARVQDGVVRNLDAVAYALGIVPDTTLQYHLGGGAQLDGGVLTLSAFARPITELHGPIHLYDGGVATPNLQGALAGATLHASGGIYGFVAPQFRLGVRGEGELASLRHVFTFASNLPVRGRARLASLVESAADDPLVITDFTAPSIGYAQLPIHDVSGRVTYHHSDVLVAPLHGFYGPASVVIGGEIETTERAPMQLAIRLDGSASSIPYAASVVPQSTLRMVALLTGSSPKLHARGALEATGPSSGSAFFRVNEDGTGSIGPIAIARPDGSSVAGGLSYANPGAEVTLWLDADRFRVDSRASVPPLPGFALASLPPAAGTLDGRIVATGRLSDLAVAGHVGVSNADAAGVHIASARADVAGGASRLGVTRVALDSSFGRFTGSGSYGDGALEMTGDLDANLDGLPAAAGMGVRGRVHGPVAIVAAPGNVVAQLAGGGAQGLQVRGVSIQSLRGTVALRDGRVAGVAALAGIGGATAALAGDAAGVGVTATGVDAAAVRGAGVPLGTGSLSVLGTARVSPAGTGFRGAVAVEDGRYQSYPLSGSAEIAYGGSHVAVTGGLVAVGPTVGSFDGTVDGVGATPRYDVHAQVRDADIGSLAATAGRRVPNLTGTLDANLRVRGSGGKPQVAGTVAVPEGIENGLAFRDGRAEIEASSSRLAARGGSVTVGSTTAHFSGAAGPGALDVALRADHADLSDFNDFFDEAETLRGHGSLRLAFADNGRRTTTSGAVAIRDLRYKTFALGDTDATWSPSPSGVRTAVHLGGKAGTASATGTIALARGPATVAIRDARYDLTARVRGLDLKTWLPAFGLTEPVLGTLDADARAVGRYPALGITSSMAVNDGMVGTTRIERLTASAVSRGNRTEIRSADLVVPFGEATATGSFSLDRRAPLALALHARVPNLSSLAKAYVAHAPSDVAGSLESDVRIDGSLAHPHISGGFDLENARARGIVLTRAVGSLGLSGRDLVLNDAELVFPRGTATIAGSLPIVLSPLALGPRAAPLSVDVTSRGVDVGQFSALFPSGTKLGGLVDGHFGVQGTVAAAQLFGSIGLSHVSYVSDQETQPLRNIAATVNLQRNTITLAALHADAGSGTIDASGRIVLRGFRQAAAYSLTARARHALLDLPAYGRGTVDADVTLAATRTIPLLSGTATLTNADIPFSAIETIASAASRSGSGSPDDTAAGGLPNVAFALDLTAGKNVRLRGTVVPSAVLDLSGHGNVALTGTLDAPRLDGSLVASSGGTLTDFNRVFRVESASVAFAPDGGVIPNIDVRATTHINNPDPDPSRNVGGTVDVTVAMTGPATSPSVVYSSNPQYSKDTIVGLLLDAPLLGAVNFNRVAVNGTLPGAPGESNVLLPPSISVATTGSSIDFNQEAFSVFNAQVAQRFLGPIEDVLGRAFGLTQLDFNIDYGGGIGFDARKQVSRNGYVLYGNSLNGPQRERIGYENRPDAVTSIGLSIYRTSPISLLTQNPTTVNASNITASGRRITPGQPLGSPAGFNFTVTRLTW